MFWKTVKLYDNFFQCGLKFMFCENIWKPIYFLVFFQTRDGQNFVFQSALPPKTLLHAPKQLSTMTCLISGLTGSKDEVVLQSHCSLASPGPAWILQMCVWRAMWEQTAFTQGASSISKHLSKTSDVCLFFSLDEIPNSQLNRMVSNNHYNMGIVIINSNIWSGLIYIYFFSPLQVTSTAVHDYSNVVWLHSAVPVIFCHVPRYIIWFMGDILFRCVGGRKITKNT